MRSRRVSVPLILCSIRVTLGFERARFLCPKMRCHLDINSGQPFERMSQAVSRIVLGLNER